MVRNGKRGNKERTTRAVDFGLCEGGIAARMQGYEAHDKFMLELQHFKFVERGDIRDRQPIVDAAERAGLDMGKFKAGSRLSGTARGDWARP